VDALTLATHQSLAAPGGDERLPARALGNVLVLAAGLSAAIAVTMLIVFDGWEYYRAPFATRGYLPAHALLRPSGPVGLALGVAGVMAMLATIPYVVRKRWRRLSRLGRITRWLEVHIFFGIVGPVLITFHTSFKFNGLISAGYWLMMTVWASGFVGRYLYVRIPRSIRGVDLTRREVEERLEALRARIALLPVPPAARRELESFETVASSDDGGLGALIDLFVGELRARVRLTMLRRRLRTAGVEARLLHDRISLAAERATLARRATHLHRTQRLFELWHVFHRPLVAGMFVIVAVHVAIALYLGYARLFD
jgi:hypothetical protein